MAAKKHNEITTISLDTIVTVVARKGEKVFVKDMTYREALKSKKEKKKFHFTFYQKGFCAVKPTE